MSGDRMIWPLLPHGWLRRPPLDFPSVPRWTWDEARPLLRSCDILLCSGTRPFSRLIQRFTGSPWSHVALLYRNVSIDRIMVFESVESVGTWTVPASHYASNYRSTGQRYPGRTFIARHRGTEQFTELENTQLYSFAFDRCGRTYDRKEIRRIARCIRRPQLIQKRQELIDASHYICSVYAGICLDHVGITIPPNPRGYLAPADYGTCTDLTLLCEII